jgi:hypothetical protein
MRIKELSIGDSRCSVICVFPRDHVLKLQTGKYKGGGSCVYSCTNESHMSVVVPSGAHVASGVFSGSSCTAGLTFLTVPLLPLR